MINKDTETINKAAQDILNLKEKDFITKEFLMGVITAGGVKWFNSLTPGIENDIKKLFN